MDYLISTYDRVDGFDWVYGLSPLSEWTTVLGVSVGYLVTIFALRYLTPSPMRFRWLQALHNLFLCLLSVSMLIGVLFEAFSALKVR
jgi:hypothetical protein